LVLVLNKNAFIPWGRTHSVRGATPVKLTWWLTKNPVMMQREVKSQLHSFQIQSYLIDDIFCLDNGGISG
jgi:hypothetical protein